MNGLSLKEIIISFKEEIQEKEKAREEILSTSRTVTRISKQAVMAIHRHELGEAKTKLQQAKIFIEKTENILDSHQDLVINSIRTAYQEYAEAQVFLWLVEKGKYPHPCELNIPIIPYILGLADTIGEFRRRTLDFLREGKLKDAENCHKIMDEVYTELINLDSAYVVAPELRRKCDIARHVIESTIGDIATETRRISLEKSIKLLDKRIGGLSGEVKRKEARTNK